MSPYNEMLLDWSFFDHVRTHSQLTHTNENTHPELLFPKSKEVHLDKQDIFTNF